MASLTELSFNWKGFISAMTANVAFTYRNIYSKKAMVCLTLLLRRPAEPFVCQMLFNSLCHGFLWPCMSHLKVTCPCLLNWTQYLQGLVDLEMFSNV
jgi:hypothetical protein